MRHVRQWRIPIDGEWHGLALTGPVLYVAISTGWCMELWSEHSGDGAEERRWFRPFRDGAEVGDCAYIGSAISPRQVAWHLYERT